MGEALEQIEGRIRVVRNSSLSRDDVEVAKGALAAMRHEWYGSRPENLGDEAKPRFKRLFNRTLNDHHPYIRTIVLRTREYLETAIDPETRTDGSSMPGGFLMVPPDEECSTAGMGAVRQGFICPPQTGAGS